MERSFGGICRWIGHCRVKIAIVHDWLVTYAGAERVLADDPELAKPQNKLLCELAAKYVSKKETDFSMIS